MLFFFVFFFCMTTSYSSENNELFNSILTKTKKLYPTKYLITQRQTHFYDDDEGRFVSFPNQPALEELFSKTIHWDSSAMQQVLKVKPQLLSDLPNHDELAILFDDIYNLSVFFGRELYLLQITREKFIYNLKFFIYKVTSQEDRSIMNTLCCSYVTKLNLDISTLYSKYLDSLKYYALTSTAVALAVPSSVALVIATATESISPTYCTYLAPGVSVPFIIHLPFFIYPYVKYYKILNRINTLKQSTGENSV